VPSIGRWGLIGVTVVALGGGCGSISTAQTLSAVDLQRITTVQPAMQGWDWPPEPLPRVDPPPSEAPSIPVEPSVAADPLNAELERQINAAGGIVAADGSRWQDADKLGATFAWLLKDADGARTMLAAERAFERGWAERDGGNLKDLAIDGLGDEAWGIVAADSPVGKAATYGWRRNSLVLMVHVQCIFQACPSDVGLAVRAWVDAIDHGAAGVIANPATSRP
jgi:hypothetical protein